MYVPPKNSSLTDEFLETFKDLCGKCHCSGQYHQSCAQVLGQDKSEKPMAKKNSLVLVPSTLSFTTSIDSWMYLDSSFDDHVNWIAMDKVAPTKLQHLPG